MAEAESFEDWDDEDETAEARARGDAENEARARADDMEALRDVSRPRSERRPPRGERAPRGDERERLARERAREEEEQRIVEEVRRDLNEMDELEETVVVPKKVTAPAGLSLVRRMAGGVWNFVKKGVGWVKKKIGSVFIGGVAGVIGAKALLEWGWDQITGKEKKDGGGGKKK